jgi:hypothetical protein
MPSPVLRSALSFAALAALACGCVMDQAPTGLRRTPSGPGATVRFDLAHQPLPDIPLPNDTATWPDPTSRTGLRLNGSLAAPTNFERQARLRFSQLEGWGTFAPISVSFDIDPTDPAYRGYTGAALDLANVAKRHQGDDYDFADDAVYLVNLTTGVPVALDVGAGNFNYTLKELDAYWANDTRATERNLLFETIDETKGGAVTPATFKPADDTDFDGVLDQPDLDDPSACPGPDPVCDDASSSTYGSATCLETRRTRDRCIADHLLVWYERETDTLILRPLLPLDEMTRYAVVITDRTVDGRGNAVKSPFDFVYEASMESTASRVRDLFNTSSLAAYWGDLAGTGLDHVAFTWSFTTQPTVDDLKRLRDGLYGEGPFARWAKEYPPSIELDRAIGVVPHILDGTSTDPPGWQTSSEAKMADCAPKLGNLYVIKYDDIQSQMKVLLEQGFGFPEGPGSELLLTGFENIDHMVIGTFKSPFLITGGPKGVDPEASFDLNFVSGQGFETFDTVQFWIVVPRATAAFKQPFNVNVYGHGYTGNFSEMLVYAGNMAQHGLATVGFNAAFHGLVLGDAFAQNTAATLLANACVAPFYDAMTQSRARDLNNDGIPDSGGDFWSSYLFHTRDGVRQSVLDEIQLVRILRAFGTPSGKMLCRNDRTGWAEPATQACDVNADGKIEVAGDFDGDGTADLGGPEATYGTWGESLGGILSGIHGALDPHVSAAVPGSGGAGLTDVGVRSFQSGVTEAVLLRVWGPLLVTVPGSARSACGPSSTESDNCTLCAPDQLSLRWVMPNVNATGELEIGCFDAATLSGSTVLVHDLTAKTVDCASVSDAGLVRVGVPASIGDAIQIDFYAGKDQVDSYANCAPTFPSSTAPTLTVSAWGKGFYPMGAQNDLQTETCGASSCVRFQEHFYSEGSALIAPAEGLGEIRQTPALRRFLQLAQIALDPGDPASFAPYYAIKPMIDPSGAVIPPRAVLTLNTIGDMNVPLNAGIAFARAAGALPFMRPDQVARFPEYASYATPPDLYVALGNTTPNQVLIDDHVIEGIAPLARYPASAECPSSQNAKYAANPGATFPVPGGAPGQCYPTGCMAANNCWYDTSCNPALDACVPISLGQQTCDEALFDVDDLDEGTARYFQQTAPIPLRLARYAEAATAATLTGVWAPRLLGAPGGVDLAWTPKKGRPITALLDAYIVPQGVHTFVNGEPCQSFDAGTYLTNLTARFFMTGGTDLYYLSHPSTHRCLQNVTTCGYLD